MKSTSSELQIDGRPAILRSTATRTIGSLGAQEIIPNEGATKDGLLTKVWLYFRGDSQDAEIGSGSNSGVVGDPGSGHVGLESLEFVNNTSNISPSINVSLAGFDAFTIGCWVRFDGFGFAGPWGAWNGTGSTGQIAIYNGSGNSDTLPRFGVTQDNGNYYEIAAKTKSWKVNYWHYCLCEVDTINLIARLWIDNKLQGTVSLPSGFTLNTSIYTFKMGGYDGQSMSGNIEEFAVFNDVLTQDERDWLWNKSYGNTLSSPASVVIGDPYSASVTFLTYCDKYSGGNDETGKQVTANGTARIVPSYLTKNGGFFIPELDPGSIISTPHTNDHNFGSGRLTIEVLAQSNNWYNGASYFGAVFAAKRGQTNNIGYSFAYYLNALYFFYTTNGTTFITKSVAWTPLNNTKYYIAVARDGSNLRFAVNGSQVGATQSMGTDSIFDSTEPLRIGGDSFNSKGSIVINGIRITKGVARDILNPDPLPWAYP